MAVDIWGVVACVTSVLAFLASGVSIQAAQRGHGAALLTRIESLSDQVRNFQEQHEAREAKLTELRIGVHSALEEVDQAIDTIEKKRKQTTNQANRLARMNGGDEMPQMSPEDETRAFFRAQGLNV